MIKMKKPLLLLALIPFFSYSQETDQQVIASAGDHSKNGDYSLSWTIGETVISTGAGGDYVLTQGFHQGNLHVTKIIEEKISYDLEVYPNPVSNILTIETTRAGISYQLLNINGKVLHNGKLDNTREEIDFSGFPPGTYILKTGEHQTHKIIKQ